MIAPKRPLWSAIIAASLAAAAITTVASINQPEPPTVGASATADPAALSIGLAVIRCGRATPDDTSDVAQAIRTIVADLAAYAEHKGCVTNR